MAAKRSSISDVASIGGESVSRSVIRVPKAAEMVAHRIREQIVSGELKDGDFLPIEGQLTADLGISRPTLREAMRILEAEQLVSVMRGSRTGASIHSPQIRSASRYARLILQAQNTTIADVYEARLAIEPFIARRLAETQPEGATERLRAEIERLSLLMRERRYVDLMVGLAEFHRLLVELGGNKTLLLLTTLLQDLVASHQVEFFKHYSVPTEAQRTRSVSGLGSFRKLVSLIEAGNADGAESHWRLHLVNANRAWIHRSNAKITIETLE